MSELNDSPAEDEIDHNAHEHLNSEASPDLQTSDDSSDEGVSEVEFDASDAPDPVLPDPNRQHDDVATIETDGSESEEPSDICSFGSSSVSASDGLDLGDQGEEGRPKMHDQPKENDLTDHLQSEFKAHRRNLRKRLGNMKDRSGRSLYSAGEIDQYLEGASTTANVVDYSDAAFGHCAITGHFEIPYDKDQPTDFDSEPRSLSRVTEWLAEVEEKRRSYPPGQRGITWVHLPVNNLALVEEAMLGLISRTSEDVDQSKAIRNRSLRRERAAVRRQACGNEMLATGEPLQNTCRKTQVSRDPEQHHLKLIMPYLHWERSLARIHASSIVEDAQKVAKDLFKRKKLTKLDVREVSALPCTGFEKMVRYHSFGRPGLSMRQTLDQSYYQTLESVELRNCDQVVEKYSRNQNWPNHEHCILMVDQLWLWVLNEDTVLSCFPDSFANGNKLAKRDILPSLLKYLNDSYKRRWIRSADQLAFCIADRCASNVFDQQLHSNEKFNFLGMFQHSIAEVMDKQSKLYVQMIDGLRKGPKPLKFDAASEFLLLEEAKDILDELRIMRDINSEQAALLRTLSSLVRIDSGLNSGKKDFLLDFRPKKRAEFMREMIIKAESAYEAIIHLIDIKQRQINLFQATDIRGLLESNNKVLASTNQTLQQSEKSGETLMVFTVVTILFLPLSTLASFFSLNARELNGANLSIGVVLAYIFPISLFIVFLSLIFGFSSSARRSLPWARKEVKVNVAQHLHE